MPKITQPIISSPANTDALAQAPTPQIPIPVQGQAPAYNAKNFERLASYNNRTTGVFGSSASSAILKSNLCARASQICEQGIEFLNLDDMKPENLRALINQVRGQVIV